MMAMQNSRTAGPKTIIDDVSGLHTVRQIPATTEPSPHRRHSLRVSRSSGEAIPSRGRSADIGISKKPTPSL